MNTKNEELIKLVENNTLDSNSTFRFSCNACGNCCRNRSEGILLNGIDVLNIARAVQLPITEVLDKYTERYIGESSKLPLMVLKERTYDGSCCFLRKGVCSIHKLKPMVCRLYPLGRAYSPETNTISYFINPDAICAGASDGKSWTLEEWLQLFDVHQYDEDSLVWHSTVVKLAKLLQKEKRPEFIEHNANGTAQLLYGLLDYQSPLSYGEQVIEILRKTQEIIKE